MDRLAPSTQEAASEGAALDLLSLCKDHTRVPLF
jgi:hypothetical protein